MENIKYNNHLAGVKQNMGAVSRIEDLVDFVISEAVLQKASDIHIEPLEDHLRIRFRIDGLLQTVYKLPMEKYSAVVSRIKVISGMDIAEKRIPQDGRLGIELKGQPIDLRVSTLPTVNGEKAVIRILDKASNLLDVANLGMTEVNYRLYRKLYSLPHGIILVTGPTGSGKSTTLYAALNAVNTEDKNIITIEDPVEYKLPGINQTAVNNKAGLTFSIGLRSIIRQDPNIIMIGEIRDAETAKIAVQAAMTGHLVLSTLHTNSAAGAVTRLIDMGIEPFLLASTLRGIVAQRLVRYICPKCKEKYAASPAELDFLQMGSAVLYKGTGCEHCRNTGYSGRLAVHEILLCNAVMRRMILKGAEEEQLYAASCSEGSTSLKQDGIMKALAGRTTVSEIMRAVYF